MVFRRRKASKKQKSTENIDILLLGAAGCGKSTFLHRYMHGVYRPQDRTLFSDEYKLANDHIVTDPSGIYEFQSLRDSLARTSRLLIICYNAQSPQTLNEAQRLLQRYEGKERLLCGLQSHDVSTAEGAALAEEFGVSHCAVDAETGHSIAMPFTWASRSL